MKAALAGLVGAADGATGLILVDHGSRKAGANEMLLAMAEMFRRASGLKIVEPAHMELAEPTIAQAFAACVRQGAKRVVVHPYFLAPGRHSTVHIPQMVREAAAQHPGVRYHVTPPLGLDEKIAHVILDRVTQCLRANLDCGSCPDEACRRVRQKMDESAGRE